MSYAQAIGEALHHILSWPTPGYIALGVVIGLAVGLLPGLGGPTTMAILIPITFSMEAVDALALLVGMLAVTSMGGSTTAILFGVPGDTTSAVLVLDGYQLTKRGEAGRALGAQLAASLGGSWISALLLAAMIPIARPLVLAFGSPEFFMLICVGLTFIASLSGRKIHAGLICVALGLLLSTVGVDPQLGIPRFTLGVLHLFDGLHLVPLTIGLFAIPVLADLVRNPQGMGSRSPGAPRNIVGVLGGAKEVLRYLPLVVRSTGVGAFIAALPGLGGAVAQWIVYGQAQQLSKRPEEFGKGSIEGVIGPAAANDANEAGGLIPTIAFGIPGTLSMAILLGAFLIHGIVPGPDMVTVNLPLTLSFVWTISLASFMGVVILFILSRPLAQITQVQTYYIVPGVLIFVFIGTYTARNALLDVAIMLGFGLVGVVLQSVGWPKAALLLGFVLGRLGELYLFRSYVRYGFEWLQRPSVIVLLLVAVASLLVSLRRSGGRQEGSDSMSLPDDVPVGTQPTRTAVSRAPSKTSLSELPVELILSGMGLAIGIVTLLAIFGLPQHSRLFPGFAVAVMMVAAVAGLGRNALMLLRGHAASREPMPVGGLLKFSVWFGFFVAAITVVGIAFASAIMAAAYVAVGSRRWGRAIVAGLIAFGAVFVLTGLVGVSSPRSMFF